MCNTGPKCSLTVTLERQCGTLHHFYTNSYFIRLLCKTIYVLFNTKTVRKTDDLQTTLTLHICAFFTVKHVNLLDFYNLRYAFRLCLQTA